MAFVTFEIYGFHFDRIIFMNMLNVSHGADLRALSTEHRRFLNNIGHKRIVVADNYIGHHSVAPDQYHHRKCGGAAVARQSLGRYKCSLPILSAGRRLSTASRSLLTEAHRMSAL